MSSTRYKELYGSKSKNQIGTANESVEQISLFKWADFASGTYPSLSLMFHIPNGGKRTKSAGGKLKAEGLRAGVPDICLPVPIAPYHGLFIELKVLGGRLSKEQTAWIEGLSLQGYMAVSCYGFEEAQSTIIKYLKGAG